MTSDPRDPPPRLGILAGGGSVPGEVAAAAAARGWPVQVVAIDGEADQGFGKAPVERVNWGQIGRMIRTFRQAGVTHLVIVGRVSRPDLTRVRPDLGLLASIPWILRIVASGGDDGVLRNVVRFFEDRGFKVLSPADVAPDLVVSAGSMGNTALTGEHRADVALGLAVIRALGPFDVGQSVVVAAGKILAIEGAEGTDRMLTRLATPDRPAAGGLLVKRPKPGQEMRVDMPTIGPETVSRVAQAALSGIAVMAGKVLATQRSELLRRADAEGIVVAGVEETAAPVSPQTAPPVADDIAFGIAVLQRLQPYAVSRAVVVANRYVLAIETGEGIDAVLERVAHLRQWGSARMRKRAGFVVVAGDVTVDEAQIAKAAVAGLHGLALAPMGDLRPFLTQKASKRAAAAGLQIVMSPAPRVGDAA